MGFWDFLTGSGKKLETETPDAAPTPAVLKKEVAGLGLDATGLDIKVEGDKVKVEGTAVSPEVKEKVILAVGNVQGVASVEAEDDPGAPPPRFHTVKKGETLSHIAKAELGSANRYSEIFEANRPMLTHPDKIYPGQVLRIPQKA